MQAMASFPTTFLTNQCPCTIMTVSHDRLNEEWVIHIRNVGLLWMGENRCYVLRQWKKQACLWNSTPSCGEGTLKEMNGEVETYMARRWANSYIHITKQKEPQLWAYLQKYIQVNWGHCTWKIPPGWPGTTAPCLRERERERERDGVWFGDSILYLGAW